MRFLQSQTMLTFRTIDLSDLQHPVPFKCFLCQWSKRTIQTLSQCVQVREEIKLPVLPPSGNCPLHTTTARTQATHCPVAPVASPQSAAQAASAGSSGLSRLWRRSTLGASPANCLCPKTLSSLTPAAAKLYTDPPATPGDPTKDQVGSLHQSASPRSTPEPLHGLRKKNKGPVAVAISGGVDSAVAAMLLKNAGHELFGIFMRNWDESEETGNQNCSIEEDHRDAKRICDHLGIPLHEADFVDQYWNRVFSHFVTQYSKGLTPNPDLECNRCIKFDALLKHAEGLGADQVATGHYVRLKHDVHGGPAQLLKGLDPNKDQSYFLASVPAQALQRFTFPLGNMTKPDVRALAASAGLSSATRRSSAGVCFIGRRKFGKFIAAYAEPLKARYISVETGKDLGECTNLAAVTWGQGAAIGGHPHRCYVVGKDVPDRIVYVTDGEAGQDHPALFSRTALLHSPQWVAGHGPQQLPDGLPMHCSFKARYRQADRGCQLATASSTAADAGQAGLGLASAADFAPSKYTRLTQDNALDGESLLHVRFDEPLKAATPEQAFVMYDGDVCLGSALVHHPGPTLHETDSDI